MITVPLVTLAACSGGGPSPQPTSPPVAINVAPSVTVSTTSTVFEGITKFVARISATDADGDVINYSIQGPDAQFFGLSFDDVGPRIIVLSNLDFEDPRDADHDNVYMLEAVASDNVNSSTFAFTVTVTDIANDGIFRISDANGVYPSPDLNADSLPDIVVTSDTPENAPVGSELAGVIISRAALTTEGPIEAELSALYAPGAGARSALAIIADDAGRFPPRLSFTTGQTLNGTTASTYLSMTGYEFDNSPAVQFNRDTAVIFPDTYQDILIGTGTLDLADTKLPMGVRSTQSQVIGGLEAFVPVGDFNGDGISEVIEDRTPSATAEISVEASFSIFDGIGMRSSASGSLFPSVLGASPSARTLTFSEAEFVANKAYAIPQAYRSAGKVDVTGDGVDDFVVNIGLRGNQPVTPNVTPGPEGTVIEIVSGAALMARPAGSTPVESFISPERLRITVPSDFAQPFLADVADFNEDGFADIVLLVRNNNDPGSRGRAFDAYIVSGAALVNAPNGVLDLADFPGSGGTVIRMSARRGQLVNDAFAVSDMIGGPSQDLVLTNSLYTDGNTSNRPIALLIAGDLFNDGFPEILDLADQQTGSLNDGLSALPRGSAVRIDGPPVDIISVATTSYGRTRFVFENAGTDISDGDGDGYPDLALVRVYDRDPGNTSLPGIDETDLFIIPSGIIRAAAQTGDTVEVGNSFD